ncbi:hydroxyacylglutathione hydrolase [Kangiella sediminilitoris]|uniref:Hydroxyacylglutathione hydrolase n=1 Tax=Kangiella sediminilitoris TaxID=1144748 RepID=A0A1B3B9D7_9GAMM|nr:hydroxyacylglutathione hydrolase [Kangiella sediminilitoris]AOE49366.1 Hydroxyacylglutathione hydrolase [Kangiella sediminilitoris]
MKTIPVEAFNDNYIWLIIAPDGHSAAVVDPGDANPVIEYLDQHRLALDTILVTHHHHDHIGGVKKLKARYGCRVVAPRHDQHSFSDQDLTEGDEVSILDDTYRFKVLEVPGHTMGHIAFYGHGAVFCGDTLFKAGCGRMFEGTPPIFHQSLKKLANLPAETKVYCAHEYTLTNLKFAQTVEPDNEAIRNAIEESQALRASNKPTLPSTIGEELTFNPFLRCEQESVQKAAENAGGDKTFSDPVRTFATIRQLKDNF